MLKNKIFYFTFIYIICYCSVTKDDEIALIEKDENVLEQQNISSNYFDKNEYLKLKNGNIYIFKQSYKAAQICLKLFEKKYRDSKINKFSLFAIDKFIQFLTENLNIDTKTLELLKDLLNYTYLSTYFNTIKEYFDDEKNKETFNFILNAKNIDKYIENNIDFCFYEITSFFNELSKKIEKDYFYYRINTLNLFYKSRMEKYSRINTSKIIPNDAVLFLFSPYFLCYYIFYRFVEIYLEEILIFFEKYANKSKNKSDYKFKVENFEKDKYFFSLKNKSKHITITLKIEKIQNNEVHQTENRFSLIDLNVYLDADFIFDNLPLLSKDNLKSIFKKDSELSSLFDIEYEKILQIRFF